MQWDLYLRDLYQDKWDECTAPTQYQTTGSSHELASLLITELTQYSINVADKLVYLLILDAQSAFDRCLRQILCTELFKTGMSGPALLLLNNRLKSRSTVYQWDGQMLGPAQDITGFEQGGINSADFYKLYNNTQLKSAQSSGLGVCIGSSIVSAVGQADDVILAANSIDCLKLLAMLTESYCARYRVKLVSNKTKLLPVYHSRHKHLVEYAKLINPVTIDGDTVQFVKEAEHVGVLRSTAGNMPHILERIAAHKKALGAVCSAGMSHGHRGNPAASLRVHQMYATPVLLLGLATLVLNKTEMKVLSTHYKCTVQKIQKLHQNTPRAVVFFLAGCLPGEAVLHSRQLGLFSMVSHLPSDPLHSHGKYILTSAPASAHSWFQQIAELCTLYQLPDPLQLLCSPPPKLQFKKEVKNKITQYWHSLLRTEVAPLKSLKYFKPDLYSLTKAHYMWTTAASNPHECSKSSILSKMVSGRYRTDMLCRHWSDNRAGYCRAPTCHSVPGTLEHLLVSCPALSQVRERLYCMMLEKSVMFPPLHSTIREVLECSEEHIVQLILEPLSFPVVNHFAKLHGARFIAQLSYLTRTFAFYIDRHYKQILKLLKKSPTQHQELSLIDPNVFPVAVDLSAQTSVSVSSTTQSLRRPCQAVLLGGVGSNHNIHSYHNIHSSEPTVVCPSSVTGLVPHPILDSTHQPVTCPTVTRNTGCLVSTISYPKTMVNTSVTMTMTGPPMTTPPPTLPYSATIMSRADRAFSGPVVFVTDSTVHSSSSTAPVAPSLTSPATRQHSCLAAPWTGHSSTVTKT